MLYTTGGKSDVLSCIFVTMIVEIDSSESYPRVGPQLKALQSPNSAYVPKAASWLAQPT
jgi:hypothetical protein